MAYTLNLNPYQQEGTQWVSNGQIVTVNPEQPGVLPMYDTGTTIKKAGDRIDQRKNVPVDEILHLAAAEAISNPEDQLPAALGLLPTAIASGLGGIVGNELAAGVISTIGELTGLGTSLSLYKYIPKDWSAYDRALGSDNVEAQEQIRTNADIIHTALSIGAQSPFIANSANTIVTALGALKTQTNNPETSLTTQNPKTSLTTQNPGKPSVIKVGPPQVPTSYKNDTSTSNKNDTSTGEENNSNPPKIKIENENKEFPKYVNYTVYTGG